MHDSDFKDELHAIESRYAMRESRRDKPPSGWTDPAVYLPALDKYRMMLQLFARSGLHDFSRLRLLEVGCGNGVNLLRFVTWGFDPVNLVGNELLPTRIARARKCLPGTIELIEGDASALECGPFDIVFQSTVFSSILSSGLQTRLARKMWAMTRPGGAVLWYDFCYNNPKNPDVRGVPPRRIRELFPESRPIMKRVTLAPPISRAVTRYSPRLYSALNAVPLLRTHMLCWIPKAA